MEEHRITIIGRGNVGTHLMKAFTEKAIDCHLVDSRELFGLQPSLIYIICVKDDVIAEVAARLKEKLADNAADAIVVHTAGTKPMSLLADYFPNHGVFYPMQTFSKEKALAYSDIPIFLEASTP
ncbi:MAG: DUF2520 domain-containing protein, partial [Bacteroidaceae bacterium]|nr:DUF2520 domain-containing protein [Bacteroidaceae bacterium]